MAESAFSDAIQQPEQPPQHTYFIGVPEDIHPPQLDHDVEDHDDFGNYVPMRTMEPNTKREAAVQEQIRFDTTANTAYQIPLWDQGCVKHVFKDAFDPEIDAQELQALGTLLITVLINIAVVSINVFGTQVEQKVLSAFIATRIVFFCEMVIVYVFVAILLLTLLDAWWHNNVGTNIAVDTVELGQTIASFSTLKIVGVVSPAFLVQKILPVLTVARTAPEYIKGVFMVLAWLFACFVAVLTIVAKVSQVGFTGEVAVNEWSGAQVMLVLGLCLNLAKVDESYAAEMSTLLKAVHRHYVGPGGPDSVNPKDEGLYSKILAYFGIERQNTYEFFEAVFDHHFGVGDMDSLSTQEKFQKTLNFMAFISKIDDIMLKRFLQMVQSPIDYYDCGRKGFEKSWRENDLTNMEVALWRSDPTDEATIFAALEHPERFRQTYTCYSPPSSECGDTDELPDTLPM